MMADFVSSNPVHQVNPFSLGSPCQRAASSCSSCARPPLPATRHGGRFRLAAYPVRQPRILAPARIAVFAFMVGLLSVDLESSRSAAIPQIRLRPPARIFVLIVMSPPPGANQQRPCQVGSSQPRPRSGIRRAGHAWCDVGNHVFGRRDGILAVERTSCGVNGDSIPRGIDRAYSPPMWPIRTCPSPIEEAALGLRLGWGSGRASRSGAVLELARRLHFGSASETTPTEGGTHNANEEHAPGRLLAHRVIRVAKVTNAGTGTVHDDEPPPAPTPLTRPRRTTRGHTP